MDLPSLEARSNQWAFYRSQTVPECYFWCCMTYPYVLSLYMYRLVYCCASGPIQATVTLQWPQYIVYFYNIHLNKEFRVTEQHM